MPNAIAIGISAVFGGGESDLLVDNLELEDGNDLLLETGNFILLES